MPSGRSVKPGDIVTALNGKTIEVNNTDAEGRLILADGLALAAEAGPDAILDLATLTGSVVYGLGLGCTGVFGNGFESVWWCQPFGSARSQTCWMMGSM